MASGYLAIFTGILFSWWVLGRVGAATVTSAQYHTLDIEIGSDQNFEIALFKVTLDSDLYVNGTLISQLSNELPYGAEASAGQMPISVMALLGTATLTCNCTNCSSEIGAPYNASCSDTECVYLSTGDMNQNGPPAFAIPMPAVTEPAFAIFTIFSGSTDTTGIVAANKTYNIVKILRTMNQQQQWVDMVPPSLDLSNCVLTFGSNISANASGTPSLNTTTTPQFEADNATCNYTLFLQQQQDLLSAIQSTDGQSGKAAMEAYTWKLAAYVSRRNMQVCQELVESLLTEGNETRTIHGDTSCHETFGSEAWEDDACCNQDKRFTSCCEPTTRTVTVSGFVGVDSDAISAQCTTPDTSLAVAKDYISRLEDSAKCSDQVKARGFDFEAWDHQTAFLQDCWTAVMGSGPTPPTCQTDADCYTRCVTSSNECVVPYDDPTDALISCFGDTMSTDLNRYLRKQFGLTGESNATEFAAAFKAQMTGTDCVGPHADQGAEKWEQQNVSSCDGIRDNCYCDQTGANCQQTVRVPGNQTNCLAVHQCNWNPNAINATDCDTNPHNPSTEFCGDCHGASCWEITEAPMCYQWVASPSDCTALNGTTGPWGSNQCVFADKVAEQDCTPDAFCPDTTGQDRWCDTFCYDPSSTNSTLCAAAAGGNTWWWTGSANGTGICRILSASCNTTAGYILHTGYSYRRGAFDTQPKCDVGRCNVDPYLNATECAAQGSCSKPCHRCRPTQYGTTLCYNPDANSTTCTTTAGTWSATYNICIATGVRDSESCSAISGFVFQQCESLDADRASCQACQSGSAGCPLKQNYLQCYSNPWDRCENQTTCEAAGECSDFELQNYQASYCQSNPNSANCTSVCVVPFTVQNGQPMCQSPLGWGTMGCINYTATSSGMCVAPGRWVARAFNQSACLAHGSGCHESRFWGKTNKSESDCASCGGTYGSYYTWTAGVWSPGEMIPMTWTNRTWGSINKWATTINFTKVNEAIEGVMSTMMGKNIATEFLCKYNLLMGVVSRLACDCADTGIVGCYNSTSFAQVGSLDLFSGLDATASWADITITVSGDAIGNDSLSISASGSTDLAGLVNFPNVSPSRKRGDVDVEASSTNPYAIVVGNDSAIIGQLVGSGVELTLPANLTEVTLCIDRDFDITLGSEFTVPDLGILVNDTVEPLWQEATIEDGVSLCETVTESGTYYPIYRVGPEAASNDTISEPIRLNAADITMISVLSSLAGIVIIAGVVIAIYNWVKAGNAKKFMSRSRRVRGDEEDSGLISYGASSLRSRASVVPRQT